MEAANKHPENERRDTQRLPLQIKFKYSLVNPGKEPGEIQVALTKNLSVSGLLFESKEILPIDAEVKILLDMPGSPAKVIEIIGKVARIERLLYSYYFDIGFNFVGISEEDKEEIRVRIDRMNILRLLQRINSSEVSDLHLTINSPAMARYFGTLKPIDDQSLSAEEIKQMIYSILSEEQKRQFLSDKDLNFAFSPSPESRYRVSIYQQRGKPEVVFRNIMPTIKNREQLGLPEVIEDLSQLKEGVIIIAGTTGSGKSTTISSMIDMINRRRGGVILSLEKPIEYLHRNIKGIVKQREVGIDVATFANGLKAALRQDPDVIVVGEVLDLDTMDTTLQAAETGHVVITSLHATDTIQVFDRIISLFPAEQREFTCARLSHCLQAVVVQKLIPHINNKERVLATEVCITNTAIKRIIHSGDFTQLFSVMQTGSKYKMQVMQDSIDKIFEQGLISAETYEMFSKK